MIEFNNQLSQDNWYIYQKILVTYTIRF